jgi:hypothetical protein
MKTTMKEIEELVRRYSSKASEYCHQLGIAGIGIIWVLNTREYQGSCSSRLLLAIAFLLFIITITISLIHYFWLAILADNKYHQNEKELGNRGITDSVTISREVVYGDPRIESYSWLFFKAKFGSLLLAFLITMAFVIINLFVL